MLFVGDNGECGMAGTRIQLNVNLVLLMHSMIEKGVVDKEQLLFLAETACKTKEEMKAEAQEILMKHMNEFVEILGSDKAGDILREAMNIKKEESTDGTF